MTGTRNPSRKYFKCNQPYFYKSVDNWEEWDTDESYDRTFFIGVDDSNPEDIDVTLYMIWGGKPVAVIGSKVLDTVSDVVDTARQLEEEIQSILEEVQELAVALAQARIDIEEAIAEMNALVDRCEGILEGAEAARDLAKDWATKMNGMVEEGGELVDYSAKYYANEAKSSETVASNSATAASASATTAAEQATAASNSAGQAVTSAGTAASYAATANIDADAAAASAQLAQDWAVSTGIVGNTDYSAKHYAGQASNSASSAAGSAIDSSASAVLAKDWATKMDGPVAGTDYSSKYYADQSADSAEQAAISAAGTHFKLFQHDWFDYELDDMAWLRADTFSWQDGTVYSNGYNHLVSDIEGVTPTTETVGGYTVTFYRAADGHKIVLADQETTVGNIYIVTGVAWYYVLDVTNKQFKLPRTKYNFNGLRDNVGDYILESLPNITGSFNSLSSGDSEAFTSTALGSAQLSGGSIGTVYKHNFDASRSSSTYQGGATVQQRGTQQYLYFYVGQFSQSATEQTAGLNAELFNGKADIDASNFNAAGKANIIGWGSPDYSAAVDYTSNWGSVITTQKHGWLWVRSNSTAGNPVYLSIGSATFNVMENGSTTAGAGSGGFFRIPPTQFQVTGGNGVSRQLFFFPCIGA